MSSPTGYPTGMNPTGMSPSAHGQAFIQTLFAKHPMAAAAAMAALVVLVLVLAFYLSKYKTKADAADASKSKLVVGNHPKWFYGGLDAAGTGSLARDTNKYQASIYTNMQKPGHSCSGTWDREASVEAEALSSVGALQPDDHHLSMSDDHLHQLMHQGGTP